MTNVFVNLTLNPNDFTLDSNLMDSLQKYVCIQYSKNIKTESVNEARQVLFTQNLRNLENIPPTMNALYQHARRSILVAAFMWRRCMEKIQDLPSPGDWGWEWHPRLSIWIPYWTDLQDASKRCSLLVKCGCQVACTGRCKCFNMGIRCGPLCKCEGACTNNED